MPSPGSSGPTNQHGPLPHSLESHGDEGHGHHHQVQDVEVVAAEGALVQEGPVGGHLGGEAACWGGAGLGTLPLIGGGARDTPLVGGALGHSPLVGVEPDDTRPLVGGAWGHAPSGAPGDTPGTQTRRALPHPQRPVLGPQGPLLGSEAMGTPGLLVIEALPSALQIQFPFLSLLLFLLLPPPLPPPPSSSSSSSLLLFVLLSPPLPPWKVF